MTTAPFNASQYKRALLALGSRVSEAQRRMLATHAVAPDYVLDVQALARAAGSHSVNYTYANYGRLGHDVARVLRSRRREWVWTRVLGSDSRNEATGLVQWQLYRELATAVRALGWRGDLVAPDPIADAQAAASDFGGVSATVYEALIEARLGQGVFRQSIISRWGACAVAGSNILEALRASHIKPWSASTNRERLDPDNGLLLVATLDALFDAGLISFAHNGAILLSPTVPSRAWRVLGIRSGMRLRNVPLTSLPYLEWHRSKVFAGAV